MRLHDAVDEFAVRVRTYVERADLVVFAVKSAEVCLVVQDEVVCAEAHRVRRRTVHIPAVCHAAFMLAFHAAETRRVHTAVECAEVEFADDDRLSGDLREVFDVSPRIHRVAVERENVRVFASGGKGLAGQPCVTDAEIEVIRVGTSCRFRRDPDVPADHFDGGFHEVIHCRLADIRRFKRRVQVVECREIRAPCFVEPRDIAVFLRQFADDVVLRVQLCFVCHRLCRNIHVVHERPRGFVRHEIAEQIRVIPLFVEEMRPFFGGFFEFRRENVREVAEDVRRRARISPADDDVRKFFTVDEAFVAPAGNGIASPADETAADHVRPDIEIIVAERHCRVVNEIVEVFGGYSLPLALRPADLTLRREIFAERRDAGQVALVAESDAVKAHREECVSVGVTQPPALSVVVEREIPGAVLQLFAGPAAPCGTFGKRCFVRIRRFRAECGDHFVNGRRLSGPCGALLLPERVNHFHIGERIIGLFVQNADVFDLQDQIHGGLVHTDGEFLQAIEMYGMSVDDGLQFAGRTGHEHVVRKQDGKRQCHAGRQIRQKPHLDAQVVLIRGSFPELPADAGGTVAADGDVHRKILIGTDHFAAERTARKFNEDR